MWNGNGKLMKEFEFHMQAGAMLGDAFLHQLPHAFGMTLIRY